MPVISTTSDPEARTLTVVAEFTAPPQRVWQVWSDPRQLERWWGPPTWPATFVEHEFTVGGRASYFMTGPEGEKSRGWWRFLRIEEPALIEFEDGFADDAGAPNPELPVVRARVELTATDGGTRMTMVSAFDSAEQLAQLIEMGMAEGIEGAMNQIDAILVG